MNTGKISVMKNANVRSNSDNEGGYMLYVHALSIVSKHLPYVSGVLLEQRLCFF
jgi:hypothetical protein